MLVDLVGLTHFYDGVAEDYTGWSTDKDGGEALAEFAGRACYRSWSKPNPATATNKGYLRNILEKGHYSVLEHGSMSLYVQGVSRAMTHELVRHRHLSFSQLSQRYVEPLKDDGVGHEVVPPLLQRMWFEKGADGRAASEIFREAMQGSLNAYNALVSLLQDRGYSRKEVREAARAVLPNATQTSLVVTGNFRAWRDFVILRGSEAADAEIAEFAVAVTYGLIEFVPNIVQDITIRNADNGRLVVEKILDVADWK